MAKLHIHGNIVFPDKIQNATLIIDNGKIHDIKEGSVSSENFYDYHDRYILPGLIEVHGHLREPGLTQKGDVPHETKAALAGGVTTILDMPNTNPPTVTVELLKEKQEKIYPKRSHTDYAFFMGAASDKLDEIKKVHPQDIVGVKVFMAGHETTPTTIPDDTTLGELFTIIHDRKMLVAIHAEDQYLINYYTEKFQQEGITDASAWSEIRPKDVIVSAVSRAIALAVDHNTPLYLLHLSTPEEFTLVDAAKEKGLKVFGELVGYQLVFNTTDYKRLGNKIKVAPALRTPEDQNEMWERFMDGGIDVVCSEHTPHEFETKKQDNVWLAQSGTPGIQETLPALLTEFIKRYGKDRVDEFFIKMAQYGAQNPAKIFNLHSKGSLEKGNDADLTVIDPESSWTVAKKDLFTKCGWSAYEGMTLHGKPEATFLRGNLVYENGQITTDPLGKWVNH